LCKCRWYFKYTELSRVLLLRPHIETFQDNYADFQDELRLEEDDWKNLKIYVTSIKTLADSSDLLEGDTYPTATSVIPFLDQV
jgi:hypothetical protein